MRREKLNINFNLQKYIKQFDNKYNSNYSTPLIKLTSSSNIASRMLGITATNCVAIHRIVSYHDELLGTNLITIANTKQLAIV